MREMTTPRTVAILGYGGLIPFVGCAAMSVLDASWVAALAVYGAVILSFVGALHWGFAMQAPSLSPSERTALYVWSVVPSLLAGVALLLSPRIGGGLLILGFLSHLVRDRRLPAGVTVPAWYRSLRLRLTLVAVVCIAVGVFASGAVAFSSG
jgi:Protein of unknown function (DUF3429)